MRLILHSGPVFLVSTQAIVFRSGSHGFRSRFVLSNAIFDIVTLGIQSSCSTYILANILLQSTMAAKYGQRNVLFLSLLGSAVTCLIFGISTSLRQAIVIRLLQGVFAGAVGVARGCVTVITDLSNEGRAYAILG